MKKRSRITLDDLNPKYREQALNQLSEQKRGNRAPIRRAGEKPGGRDALHEKGQVPTFNARCRVTVHVRKCRGNWDADNVETKAIVDSLVKNGMFADDTIKEIPEVLKIGERVKTRAEERTTIRIDLIEHTPIT